MYKPFMLLLTKIINILVGVSVGYYFIYVYIYYVPWRSVTI